MAENKKETSQRKSSSKQSQALIEKRREELMRENERRRHTTSVIMFAIGVLLTAFSFIGDAAVQETNAWDAIHGFLGGLFGITSFAVGPVVIYIAVMISADKTKATISKRMIQLTLILLLAAAAAQVLFVGSIGDPEAAEATFGDTLGYIYDKGKALSGGGIAGLIIGAPLLFFGRVGASIILFLVIFVVVMIISQKSLADMIRAIAKPFRKAGSYAKEKHEQKREENRYVQQELEKIEAEEQLRSKEERQRRMAERTSRREERIAEKQLTEEEKRARKFASIANTTTNAQQEVSEEEKRAAEAKAKEVPNPMEEQKKESKEFQKDLNDFLKGKFESRKTEPVQQTVDNVVIDESKPPEGGPYSPDGPFFADDSGKGEKLLNPVVKHDSLIGNNNEIVYNSEDKAVKNTTAPEEIHISETAAVSEAKPQGDIIEAIKDFTKEQEERNRAAEENARVLGTVLETDDNGQTHFTEIISEAEQYHLPPCELLNDVVHERSDEDINTEIANNAETLVNTLKSFGVETKFLEAARGPSVTRYELQPAPGVKISKITNLVDDIALNLATAGVRIEAPIPNKAAVGIEVPNRKVDSVPFREMVDSKEFRDTKSKLGAVLGKSISGEIVIADIAKMPHILIAGTTGSGKSVCVNSIIMSILFRSTPDEVRLLMIDPKAVEFMIYNGIPHLLIPVVTDPKKAAGALAWAVTEMLNRYKLFSDNNVRDLEGYNKLAKTKEDMSVLPQIVIFIDELADLMMASPGETEDSICRLAQMARAAGMHLVIATQRPSVNVVTGVIKANIPSRIALKVASQVDSRTIIDSAGAEKLLGKGDMLYFPVGMPKPLRVQGCWVSDKEVERVVDFIKNSFILDYDQNVMDEIEKQAELAAQKAANGKNGGNNEESGDIDVNDDKLDEAIEAVIEAGQASTSYLQRKLKLGYGRAARLIDIMEELGVVGGYEGSKPRQVLMTKQEWYERKLNKND